MRSIRRDPLASERSLAALRYARGIAKNAYHPRAYTEAADAYSVAADSLEEEGKGELALAARERARALRRKASPRESKAPSKKRTRRIYEHHRQAGKPAKEAFRLAKTQREWSVVGSIGDVNWPREEGGPILRHADGSYSVEWIEPEDERTRDGRAEPNRRFRVYRVDLDVEPLPSWIDARAVARSIGQSPTVLRKRWRSRDPKVRASARWDVALYHGWPELDDYPESYTRREIQTRYRRRVSG